MLMMGSAQSGFQEDPCVDRAAHGATRLVQATRLSARLVISY